MSDQVSLLELTKEMATRYVAEVADSTDRLKISSHAKQRMNERDISSSQILRTLKQGNIAEGPYQDTKGRWNCRFEGYSAGKGLAVVVGFYVKNGVRVIVITTFELRS